MSDRASDITSTSVDVTSTQRSLRLDGHAVWTRLEPLPGQRRDDVFACVTRGLPMPPEGLAYVVRLIGDGGDGGAREVRVVGYVDRHARALRNAAVHKISSRTCRLHARWVRQRVFKGLRAAGRERSSLRRRDGPLPALGRGDGDARPRDRAVHPVRLAAHDSLRLA